MDAERLDELERLVNRPEAYGYRSECRELITACRRLLDDNEQMRSLRVQGDYGPMLVADTLETVARQCDSSLHEVAALMIRRLMGEAARSRDSVIDHVVAMTLLKRLVANQNTRCSLDHHGYCQEHNFASPCPVPQAQQMTGSGTEYVPATIRS